MAEKISFQFLAMKAEASGLNSVKVLAFLCSLGLIIALAMCVVVTLL